MWKFDPSSFSYLPGIGGRLFIFRVRAALGRLFEEKDVIPTLLLASNVFVSRVKMCSHLRTSHPLPPSLLPCLPAALPLCDHVTVKPQSSLSYSKCYVWCDVVVERQHSQDGLFPPSSSL